MVSLSRDVPSRRLVNATDSSIRWGSWGTAYTSIRPLAAVPPAKLITRCVTLSSAVRSPSMSVSRSNRLEASDDSSSDLAPRRITVGEK